MIEGESRPGLTAAGRPAKSTSPQQAEERLLALVDEWRPTVVAIDAPLTLPPCMTCPDYCQGPGELCELRAAQQMWAAGRNPVSQRACELAIEERVGERPLPTMQLGVITARAVAFARRLANRGRPPSVLQRGEVLEVYPRATLRRLGDNDPQLLPRQRDEAPGHYRARVITGLSRRIDGLHAQSEITANGHVFDAVVAAYTGWLAPDGLEAPPEGFNIASGWIWVPAQPAG